MRDRCEQELCRNWSGDGLVCPCSLFGLEPDVADERNPWDDGEVHDA